MSSWLDMQTFCLNVGWIVFMGKSFNDVPWGVGGFFKEIVPLNEHCWISCPNFKKKNNEVPHLVPLPFSWQKKQTVNGKTQRLRGEWGCAGVGMFINIKVGFYFKKQNKVITSTQEKIWCYCFHAAVAQRFLRAQKFVFWVGVSRRRRKRVVGMTEYGGRLQLTCTQMKWETRLSVP